MIHGIVVINTIQLHAHQDGLVTNQVESALWQTQEMDLEVNQLAKIIAVDIHQDQVVVTNIDAIQPAIFARNVTKEILDVALIEPLNARIVKTQILLNSSNVIEPTQTNQNASLAQRVTLPAVCQEVKLATAALQNHNFSNVIQKR